MKRPAHYLVTGAAGFIGARLVASCRERGIAVTSVDLPAHFTEREEHRGIDFGPIVDRERLFDWLGSAEAQAVTAIVHLGACSRTTELDREFLFRNNVQYSQRLWEHAARRRLPMVYASSAATYGGGENGYADDESAMDSLRPLNPYGESKWLFDRWALAEERAGRRPAGWAGLKFFNVYGFGERHKGPQASVVLHAFDQVQRSGRVHLFQSHRPGIAHGLQRRDFIWVHDVVQVLHFCVERAAAHADTRGIYNLGSGTARSFLDLARAVFTALGRPEAIDFIPMPEVLRERYQYFTQAPMERLRALGYLPPFASLEEGVSRYVRQLAAAPVPAPPRGVR